MEIFKVNVKVNVKNEGIFDLRKHSRIIVEFCAMDGGCYIGLKL